MKYTSSPYLLIKRNKKLRQDLGNLEVTHYFFVVNIEFFIYRCNQGKLMPHPGWEGYSSFSHWNYSISIYIGLILFVIALWQREREKKEDKEFLLVISGIGFNEQSDTRIYSSKTSKTKSFVSGFRGSKSIDRTERAKGKAFGSTLIQIQQAVPLGLPA